MDARVVHLRSFSAANVISNAQVESFKSVDMDRGGEPYLGNPKLLNISSSPRYFI